MTDQTRQSAKSILIVDDEPLVRLELAHSLRACGHEAVEASNTAEALALLESDDGRFEILITDVCMPGTRNGTVLAGHVQYVWPHIKIIVISAARKPVPGALPPEVEFIPKPITAPKLVATIQSMTQH